MMYRKYLLTLLLILALLSFPGMVIASSITDAVYVGIIGVTNNSTANTTVTTNLTLSSPELMDAYDIDTNFSEVAIRDQDGNDVPFMPGYLTNPWMLYTPSINDKTILYYPLYVGDSSLNAIKQMFVDSLTITDDPSMEPTDNYSMKWNDLMLTASTDNIGYKSGAYTLTYSGANITYAVTGGQILTSAVSTGEHDVEMKQFPDLSLDITSSSYGADIWALWGDDTHIYAGGATTNTTRKYLKSDLSYIGETASYGGYIRAIWGDDTHIYVGGSITNTIRKYLKSNLSYIGQTSSDGGLINTIWGDDTHIYAGCSTTNSIRKYLKSDLSFIGETAMTGIKLSLWGDDTHIYFTDSFMGNNRVKKYLKSDLSYIGQTASYGGQLNAIWGDDTHIYAGGATTNTTRKYLKSDLSYIGETASYGGDIRAIWGDDTHIYAGGGITFRIRKYLKSDLSYIGQTDSYGGSINTLWGDDTHIHAGGSTTITINKYSILSCTLIIDNTIMDSEHTVISFPNTANNWICDLDTVLYLGEFIVEHDGDEVCSIDWNYGATFTDDSGNGNDATPVFRTAGTDLDITAALLTWDPINTAKPPAYAVTDPQDFYSDNITMAGQFTTGNVSTTGGPPGFALVSDLANAGEVPNIWVFGMIALCLAIGGHLFWIWMQRRFSFRSLWPFFFTGAAIFGLFIALGGTVKVFDFWMMVFYVIIFICIMVMSRHTEVGGNVSTHGMIGFAAQSWIGLTLINKMLESTFVGASETAWVNTFAFTQHFKLFNIFSIPVLNLDFWTKGIPSLFRWDYSFFGGNAQMFQYLLYSLTAVVAFIVFGMVIGMIYNFFTGR